MNSNVDQKDTPSEKTTTSDTKKITCVLMGKGINQQEQVRAALDKYLKAGGIIETDSV